MPIKARFIGLVYRNILKPVLFKRDPELVHDFITAFGSVLGRYYLSRLGIRWLFAYKNPMLGQKIAGIDFSNPIGLAAGFDKNAKLMKIISEVGFGFTEIGSITGEPCPGNPRPRLWRLPKYQSLVINYGLKNDGCEVITKRLKGKNFSLPLGISAAKTNSADTAETNGGISDYLKVIRTMKDIGDYLTINLSCPNAYGGLPFCSPNNLARLLNEAEPYLKGKPVFLKLSPDMSQEELDGVLDLALKYSLAGVICSNLTKSPESQKLLSQIPQITGGISGKVLEPLTNQQIKYVYRKTEGKLAIIGCGGVFSASDAYKKIKAGASLIQLATGMIFEGPQLIGEINRGLVKLLKKDGFSRLEEAIGVENRT